MRYEKTVALKNGAECCLRNGVGADGAAVLENFILTHAQTDFLRSSPDESRFDAAQEARFLQEKAESEREIEIIAVVDGVVAGTAGVSAVGGLYKVRHRAELGVSVAREYWGLGVGRALVEACIECARRAGYAQIELDVVAENVRAVGLYERAGFVECGRNPRGFRSRTAGYQEIISMRMEL